MGYFWMLVKKEYIEVIYSWKQLLLYGFLFVFFIWAVHQFEYSQGIIDWNNVFYVLTIFISSFAPGNFLTDSIFSDKRNQTFERCFVSGNIKTIMFAKLSALSVLSIIPFVAFYVYLGLKGFDIIDNVFMAINVPLYFWIGLCLITMISFIFNDEKSVAFGGIPAILAILGLLRLNDFLGAMFNPAITSIVTLMGAVIVTFAAYTMYKKTKYFLKI